MPVSINYKYLISNANFKDIPSVSRIASETMINAFLKSSAGMVSRFATKKLDQSFLRHPWIGDLSTPFPIESDVYHFIEKKRECFLLPIKFRPRIDVDNETFLAYSSVRPTWSEKVQLQFPLFFLLYLSVVLFLYFSLSFSIKTFVNTTERSAEIAIDYW